MSLSQIHNKSKLKNLFTKVLVVSMKKKSLPDIPAEVFCLIMKQSDFRTICRLACVNKQFSEWAQDNELWKSLYIQNFAFNIQKIPNSPKEIHTFIQDAKKILWKDKFKESYQNSKERIKREKRIKEAALARYRLTLGGWTWWISPFHLFIWDSLVGVAFGLFLEWVRRPLLFWAEQGKLGMGPRTMRVLQWGPATKRVPLTGLGIGLFGLFYWTVSRVIDIFCDTPDFKDIPDIFFKVSNPLHMPTPKPVVRRQLLQLLVGVTGTGGMFVAGCVCMFWFIAKRHL